MTTACRRYRVGDRGLRRIGGQQQPHGDACCGEGRLDPGGRRWWLGTEEASWLNRLVKLFISLNAGASRPGSCETKALTAGYTMVPMLRTRPLP